MKSIFSSLWAGPREKSEDGQQIATNIAAGLYISSVDIKILVMWQTFIIVSNYMC